MPAPTVPLFINLSESFENLAHAPISEAVLQIRGRATNAWAEATVLGAIKAQLPNYTQIDSQRVQQITLLNTKDSASPVVDLGWSGAIARTKDALRVANFQRDAFSFSRLAPYETWESFSEEAFRLYQMHLNLAKPAEVQRVGLRFINQFPVPATGFELTDYFTEPPSAHAGLPLERGVFFHQDTFGVPGHPYRVTVIRTFQPPINQLGSIMPPKLILDIDVFTEGPQLINIAQLRIQLQEMRWIKNKVFFGSLTPSTIKAFK
jgi:uncharacterized protein (TIGR04255 family)